MKVFNAGKGTLYKTIYLVILKAFLDGKLDNTTLIIAKAFELVSNRIIEFLSSIEEFQKNFTYEKKVVESEYCLTVDNIDEKYYDEILKNNDQLSEWEKLFSIKVKILTDLIAQPTLVLDTKFLNKRRQQFIQKIRYYLRLKISMKNKWTID
ncbi:MAG: hypothetical protein IPM96_21925 [Ignavibacteria bacterium]|nr:hypothetical protein [Ignavibacteria bacterium]